MARILVHIADTGDHPADGALNAARFRPGDIVTIKANDAEFGKLECGSHVRPVFLPNIEPWEIEHLKGKDLPVRPGDEHHARGRVWGVRDLTQLPDTFDGTAAEFVEIHMTIRAKPVRDI